MTGPDYDPDQAYADAEAYMEARRAEAIEATEDDEPCATCGKSMAVWHSHANDQWTAHWGGPGRVTIVAWTCSPACTDTYMNGGIR